MGVHVNEGQAVLVGVQPNAELPAAPPQVRLEELAARHALRVWRTLRYLGVADQDLPDASQDVFLVVQRRLGEFRGDSSLETWLYGICLRVARQSLRARRHNTFVDVEEQDPALEPTVEADLDLERARVRLRRALDRLSTEQREVFVLREIEELSMRTIAKTVGCPLFTAYSRLRLARKSLHLALRSESQP